MNITNYQLNKLVQYVFSNTSYTAPTTWYLGLSTTVIDATGATVTEPTDAAYARVSITNNGTNWVASSPAVDGQMENGIDFNFPQSTASWGTIVSVFLADASSGGNVCYYETLSPNFAVGVNTVVSFDAGNVIANIT